MSIFENYYKKETSGFDIYAYAPPTNGVWYIDGVEYSSGEDYRTVERYKEYKDTGFNILLSQTTATYNGEDWETSDTKKVMDRAYEAGLKKVILLDDRIMALSRTPGGLIGEDKQFKTQKEFDDYISACMAPYKDHPAFYGFQLKDEPAYTLFESFGQIYKTVKRLRPQTFIQCNLLPLIVLICTNSLYPKGGDIYQRYEKYLNAFLDATDADYIMYDHYPMVIENSIPSGIGRFYIKNLQIASKVCRERNVKLYHVAQAFGMDVGKKLNCRLPNRAEMYWQINLLLGFGVKQFSYFTYWTKRDNSTTGEFFKDGNAMMTRRGEKTPLYGYVKEVNEYIQKLAPLIKNFEHVADQYLIQTPYYTHPLHLEYTGMSDFENVVEAENDLEIGFVSEMYDSKNKQYLYLLQNITDPMYAEYVLKPQTIKVKFKEQYDMVDIFDNGEWRTEPLLDNTYEIKLEPGFAQFILPYKK